MQINCPKCKHRGSASSKRIPKSVRCPSCKERFLLDFGVGRDAIASLWNSYVSGHQTSMFAESPVTMTSEIESWLGKTLGGALSPQRAVFSLSAVTTGRVTDILVFTHKSVVGYRRVGDEIKIRKCRYNDVLSVAVGPPSTGSQFAGSLFVNDKRFFGFPDLGDQLVTLLKKISE